MLGYMIRRLLGMFGIALLISYAIWLFTTPTGYTAFRHFSLSSLLPSSYLLWLNGVLHGNLGFSLKEREPVLTAIGSHVLATALLVIPAFLLQQVLAIGVGVSAGVRPRSWFDRLFVGMTTVLVAIPPFWLALVVVLLAILTQGLPAFDISTLRLSGYAFNTPGYWQFFAAHWGEALVDLARHLVLPVAVLAVLGAGGDGLYVRQRMIEVMQTDYIRAARARGLSLRVVRWRHGLRNALLPILANITHQLPQLVFAAAIVEFVFQLPGAGWLFVHAVYVPEATNNGAQGVNALIDYELLSGTLLFFAGVTLLSGLFTDVLYAMADPRIRVGRSSVGLVPNPLRSRRALARVGPVTVRLGPALGVVLAVLGIVVVGITANGIRELYTPVIGNWSGTLVIDEPSQQVTLPAFLHLSVGADGKVQGQLQMCAVPVAGKNTIITVNLLGGTDNQTVITMNGNNSLTSNQPNAMIASLWVRGGYAGVKGALDLAGQVTYANASLFSAELQANPNGSMAQFQHTCGQ
jgi:peptide/nickel transport system permease protein